MFAVEEVRMARYLFSFDEGAMQFPEEELPDVERDTRAVVAAAKAAGAWIFGGGMAGQAAHEVATDGTVTERPWPDAKTVIGGFCILELASHEEALEWGAKLAAACRCTQAVREIMYDPES